jgi:hypothetical protein
MTENQLLAPCNGHFLDLVSQSVSRAILGEWMIAFLNCIAALVTQLGLKQLDSIQFKKIMT